MGDHLFEYILVILFVLVGLRCMTFGISGFLFYHKKVQARVKQPGKRYVRHPNKYIANRARADMKVPRSGIAVKNAVFTYEENGKEIMAAAVNLVGEDNTYVNGNKTYTVKVSPFDPHKCYLPALQLYKGCSIPAKIFIFVMRMIPKVFGLLLIAIAWWTYFNTIKK